MIRQISYDEIKNIKINTYGVEKKNRGLYYGIIKDEKIISIINIINNGKYYKTHCNFTLEEYRQKGYFNKLLQYILEKYNDKKIKADCLESSYRIYLKNGFELKREKQFKKFKIYYMEKN